MSRQQPTTSSPEPKISSTWSLKNKPTMPTGIIDTMMFNTYFVSAFNSHLNSPFSIQSISLHRITMVDRTVATCTATVNIRLSAPSFMPNSAWPIAR